MRTSRAMGEAGKADWRLAYWPPTGGALFLKQIEERVREEGFEAAGGSRRVIND